MGVEVAGDQVVLSTNDRVVLVASGSGAAVTVAPPPGAQGLVVAAKNAQRVVAGGGTIRFSDDGGHSWKPPRTSPPGSGPYVAVMTDPDEPDVWFFRHGARLLRTRDAGVSWRELTGLPDLAAPQMLAGSKTDEELLIDGTTVIVLDDNGNQLSVRTGLPAPARSAAALGTTVIASTAGDGRLYVSQEGQPWKAVTRPPTGPLAGFGGRVWAGDASGAVGSPGLVSLTSDASIWTDSTGLPKDQSVTGLGVDRAGSVVMAYCAGGDIYRSTDGGSTFAAFSSVLRS